MKKLILLFIMSSGIMIFSQDKADSLLNKWIPMGVAGLNISQVAFSNWSQGGEDAVTYTIVGNFSLDYKSETFAFTNALKLAYGQTKLGEDDFRTNDNELYLETVYSRRIGWIVDPYVSNLVRSSLSAGYKNVNDSMVEIANFFDPGYITQSVGFTYDKVEGFKSRLGAAFQETFTSEHTQYSDDKKTIDELEKFKFETGIESVTDVSWNFMENMVYKSKLRLFTRFEAMDVWDVRWDNVISAKVNDIIVVNLNVLVVYEQAQSLRTQIKEALQLGITYTLF